MMQLVRFAPPAVSAVVLVTSLAVAPAFAPLPPPARTVSAICIALSASVAAFVRRPYPRAQVSVGLAIAGATAAGQAMIGAPYAVLGLLLALACLASMRAVRSPREPAKGTTRKLPFLVTAAVAGGIFASLALSLPPLSIRIERYFIDSLAQNRHAMGFASTLQLGSMTGMLSSNRPVLEVEGERVDYLRGAVLDEFDSHTLRSSPPLRVSHAAPAILPQPSGATRITFVPGARLPSGERARFFVPMSACDPGTASGRIVVDAGGIMFPADDADRAVWFRTKDCRPAEVQPPRPTDQTVLSKQGAPFARIAADWTRDAHTDGEKLDAIVRELARFSYSIEGRELRWMDDPLLEFLTESKSGHCELFASSMAVLARAEHIPARVVTGYRVPPASSLTGRTIVRERHAHAWVEAWIDGAWRTYDPTPVSESMGESHTLEDLGELVGIALERAWDAIGRLSVLNTTILLGILVAAFVVVRRVAALRARRAGQADVAEALPCFETLAEALAKGGIARGSSEPIERFAQRLRTRGEPWAIDAADALARYAELRYGGIGDEADVISRTQAAAKRVPIS